MSFLWGAPARAWGYGAKGIQSRKVHGAPADAWGYASVGGMKSMNILQKNVRCSRAWGGVCGIFVCVWEYVTHLLLA